ncbi:MULTISPECIES: L,D-transpeptidase family protein [Glaesserella]|uniref:L,D-transpeptidase n=1 Tax=Glaesserella australis TaxID=2094024 RepID=A0A328BY31_9PAST|nr:MULTISPECIES: L,D-transpeptidase family protein [Glaesserella]AUI66154.1 L,D-transpeptidase [Glaesserella sp. 15-184]RAL19176.1 L,D-transpeptidase [Glaesserella australis]
MKIVKFLPLVVFSSMAIAETTVPSVVESVPVATPEKIVNEPVLPHLSFEAQQARAAEMAKKAEYILQQEQEKRIAAQKLAEAENRIRQEIGTNQLLLSSTTAKTYLDNDFAPLWHDKQAEKIFLKEYAAFVASGVSAKSAKALQQILNTNESFARDILLTDSFLDYLYYNKNVGRNANQWLYNLGSYVTKAPTDAQIISWVRASKNGTAGQFVANLVPRNHIYQETVQRLFAMSPNGTASNAKKTAKSKKATSTETSAAQSPTGSSSFTKLALNAQRLRLIPSFNNGLFVNIPSYQLYYFRDGKLALQSKVIVGRDDRRTPVMYSKLSNVVVNPPWNVPASIKNKDLVPKLRRDPGLAERLGYEIIDGNGNKVNARSIDWAAYEGKNNFPYHIRQKAGDDSALGRYKFNMPSSDAIYLHDTPNKGLFGKTDRALSSGCVRVAKADELATLLLTEAGWSESKKQNVLASNKTTSAPIRSDNPVYLYYVTSWVEGGKVYTLPDIYKLDMNLPKVSIDWAKVKNVI